MTINEFRKMLKPYGFKAKTKSLSFGVSGWIEDLNGNKMPDMFLEGVDLSRWERAAELRDKCFPVVTECSDKIYGFCRSNLTT